MLPEDGSRVMLQNVMFFKEVLDDGQNKKKKRGVAVGNDSLYKKDLFHRVT